MPLLWLMETMFAVAPSPRLPANTLETGGGDSRVFSPLFVGSVGRHWEAQQSWISHLCRLLTAIYHSHISQPSHELQLHPSFSPAVLVLPGADPFLALSLCCGSKAFFSHCLGVKKATVGCF